MSLELLNNGDFVTTKNSQPYENIQSFTGFTEDVSGETNEREFIREFRYSFDGDQFSQYQLLTQQSLQAIPTEGRKVWLDVKYTREGLDDTGSLIFTSIDIQCQSVGKKVNTDLVSNLECAQPSDYIVACANDFNPYDLGNSFMVYEELGNAVSNLYGHCADYYRVEADQSSRDPILHEYSLYEYTEKKQINVLPVDNQFPSNMPEFSIFGMDFEEWEVHILKREFENVFGSDKRPQKNDRIKIDRDERLWKISSSYLENTFDNKGIYYRVKLVKHQEEAMVDAGNIEIIEEIEELTQTFEDVLSEEREQDFKRVTKPGQYEVVGQNDNDPNRFFLSKGLTIEESRIINNHTVVADSNYDLRTISAGQRAVEYRTGEQTLNVPNKSWSFWVKTGYSQRYSRITVGGVKPLSGGRQAEVALNSPHNYQEGDRVNLVAQGWSGIYTVLTTPTDTTFTIEAPATTIISGNIDDSLYSLKLADIAFMQSDSVSLSFTMDSFALNYAGQELVWSGLQIPENVWTGVVIKLSDDFGEATLKAYTIDLEEPSPGARFKSNELTNIYSSSLQYTGTPITTTSNFKLLGSDVNITNLRIFNRLVDDENMSYVLNQYVVEDSEWLLLFDNAQKQLNVPKMET